MKHFNLILLLVLLVYQWGAAQEALQCGYVLFKEDFGGGPSSAESGSPLPKGVTTYRYTTRIPVNDGEYGIRKRVEGHDATWLHGGDHTGNGYMMLVNADYDPGKFYEKTITGLCSGSSFYFSSWIANIMKKGASGPLDPNIRFEIRKASDHSLIAEFETGLLPRYATLTWEQYGVHFDLPKGENAIILQIFNNQGGGNGNDLVLDDITLSLCGPPLNVKTSDQEEDICQGEEVTLKSTVEGGFYKDPQYQWQFSTDTLHWNDIQPGIKSSYKITDAQSSDSGWYRVLVSEKGNILLKNCRISSHAIPLKVWSPRPFSITSNSPVCEGNILELRSPQALKYEWQGPADFKSDQQNLRFETASASLAGTYSLIQTTEGGCMSKASTTVDIQQNDLSVSFDHQDTILCKGSLLTLDASNPGAAYEWNTGAQTPSISIEKGGFYKVVVNKGNCTASDSIAIREVAVPVVNLGRDTDICIGESYTLDARGDDIKSYLWNDGSIMPTLKVSEQGHYRVTVNNACGTASDEIFIKEVPCADHLIFPTAFSPNNDGQNDLFRPKKSLYLNHYELKIFDRWGKLVFFSNDPAKGWNGSYHGKTLPLGTYIWMAQYEKKQENKFVTQKGTVTLLR